MPARRLRPAVERPRAEGREAIGQETSEAEDRAFDLVLASPAERATRDARRECRTAMARRSKCIEDQRIYLAEPEVADRLDPARSR